MREILIVLFVLFISVSAFAAPNKSKDFSSMGVSLKYSYSKPNPWGDTTKDTYLEFDGAHRYGPLDLYWYVDYSNVFRAPELSDKFYSSPNYMYGEINPRISVDWVTGTTLSFFWFKEWFIAYNFEFDNEKGHDKGLLRHYLGIGTDLSVPLFDYFKVNLYARYLEKNYGRKENCFDGYMLNMSYNLTIHKFKVGISLGYSGWLKWVFAANAEHGPNNNQTRDSIQWNNSFDISYAGFSIMYIYQVNVNYSEYRQNTSGIHSQGVGIKYSVKF